MTRPVYATGGAESLRWIRITETSGKDISGDTVLVALLPYGQDPGEGDGDLPDGLRRPSANVIEAAILVRLPAEDHSYPGYTPGLYTLFGRIADAPEIEWVEGGLVEVR